MLIFKVDVFQIKTNFMSILPKIKARPIVVVHTFNPKRGTQIFCEFKNSMVCIEFQDSQGYLQ